MPIERHQLTINLPEPQDEVSAVRVWCGETHYLAILERKGWEVRSPYGSDELPGTFGNQDEAVQAARAAALRDERRRLLEVSAAQLKA